MENGTSEVVGNVTNTLPSMTGAFPLPLQISYAVIGSAGIFGNGMVLVVFGRQRFLRTITNLFIINQSVADLLASILLILNFLTPPISYPRENPPLGDFLVCAYWSSRYFYWTCQKASTFNLVVITIERYVAVVFPLKYRRRIKWKTSVILLIFTWVLSLAFQSCWLVIQKLVDGRCVFVWPNHATRIAYGIAVFLLLFILPILIMTWVYISIYKVLAARVEAQPAANDAQPAANNFQGSDEDAEMPRPVQNAWASTARDAQNRGEQQGPRDRHQNYRDNSQGDVIRTLLLVGSIFTLCWTPNMLLFLYTNLGGKVDYRSWYYHTTICLAFLNVAVNPFIYTLKYAKFRRGLAKTFGIGLSCSTGNADRLEHGSNNLQSHPTAPTLSTNYNSN